MSKNIILCDDAQQATILAALRFYQESGIGALDDIATNGGEIEALDEAAIDELCESINVSSPDKTEVITALVANGFEFCDFVPFYAETEDESPFVKAAIEAVANKEGELEVDSPAVVSHGSDDGAYVMAWLWVSNDAAGVKKHSAVLEELLDTAFGAPDLEHEAYREWLGETLANFADEIDEIESEEVGAGEPDQVVWNYKGVRYAFHPSDALKKLLARAKKSEYLSATDADLIEAFIEKFGSKLDRVLRAVTLFDADALRRFTVVLEAAEGNTEVGILATDGTHAMQQAKGLYPDARIAGARPDEA